jgi:hypothetical protein
MDEHGEWLLNLFNERERAEIRFSILYAQRFHHGTDGHNAKMIIAKLAELLDFHWDTNSDAFREATPLFAQEPQDAPKP